MRVKDEIKKSGYFWIPSTPEKKTPGTLVISDGGNIELELVGFSERQPLPLTGGFIGAYKLIRINGLIDGYGPATLDGCFFKNEFYSFSGISKSLVHVSTAFLGAAYNDNEDILFDSFVFSIEGIDEWLELSGINVKPNFKEQTSTITYNPIKEICIDIGNNTTLSIIFSWTTPILPNMTEASITQKAYFELKTKQKQEFSYFTLLAYKITTLLCLAVDEPVCIDSVTAFSNDFPHDTKDKQHHPPISIYYHDISHVKEKPQIHARKMLFRYSCVGDSADSVFNNWLKTFDIIEPALREYFTTMSGSHSFLEGKFLALAQAIEILHSRTSSEKFMDEVDYNEQSIVLLNNCPSKMKEWLEMRILNGNEPNLGLRVKRLIDPFKDYFGTSKQRNKLIRNIVDTRNYLTHYNKNLESNAANGPLLIRLCNNIEGLFKLHLLHLLGFSSSEIQTIYFSSYNLRHNLKNE